MRDFGKNLRDYCENAMPFMQAFHGHMCVMCEALKTKHRAVYAECMKDASRVARERMAHADGELEVCIDLRDALEAQISAVGGYLDDGKEVAE